MERAPVPTATYRLQLHAGFDFTAAAGVAGYLGRLGVSHAYASPYLQAAPGSTHGYDVIDHATVNAELGGAAAHADFCRALREAGLGQVLDIVPNHMSIADRGNRWWWDVLKNGRESRYADHFDVDWTGDGRLGNRLLLPVLGDHYGRELEARRLQLALIDGEPVVTYYENAFPLAPGTVEPSELSAVNANVDHLHEVLERQHYRLARWRVAGSDLAYRRFFDVNTLAALRAEREDVFYDTHALVLRWLAAGVLDGVRVDHPDGLADPEEYFRRLRDAAPHAWIVVEKVVEGEEWLPGSWPVAGTTGYEFLNRAGGLFMDAASEGAWSETYSAFTGRDQPFAEVAHAKKLLVVRTLLWSDVRRLGGLLVEVCEGQRRYRDFTRGELEEVISEVLAALPVYRTYVRPGQTLREEDATVVSLALAEGRRRRPDLDGELFSFIGDVLTLRHDGPAERELVKRFQQTSGPVTAKGLEDTAFYTYNRFVALNEVGGDPGRWSVTPNEFHLTAEATAARWPATMLTTATHDTKRGEDVRARLYALSELAPEWSAAILRWADHNRRYKRNDLPDANTEYLYYQTLVGAHPLPAERAAAYMEKAAHEAKEGTSWLDPNPDFEAALRHFVEATCADSEFTSDLAAFVELVREPGYVNSLSLKLLCLTAPGVPDLYRGAELWDFSLVDPDNRRPVDWELRARLLQEVEEMTASEAWERRDEGVPKLFLTQRVLAARRRLQEAFGPSGGYRRVALRGARAEGTVAFCRGGAALTVVPRLVVDLARSGWGDTELRLPPGRWHSALADNESFDEGWVPVFRLVESFPVAFLEAEP